MAGAVQQTDRSLDDLAAAQELLLTPAKPPRKSVTSFTLLLLLGKICDQQQRYQSHPPNIRLAILWCARTRKKMMFLLHKNSNSEQAVGILPPYQEKCISTICRENFIITYLHYKPLFGRQSSALTSKHSPGDPINETLLTHVVQVGSDSLTCLTKSEHHVSVGPIFSDTT